MKESNGVLHEFFAVTLSGSVYRISDEVKDGCPNVVKIALRGESHIGVNERLRNGNLVGLIERRIILYFEPHPPTDFPKHQDPWQINTYFWGGGTSSIVALFLREEDAMACFLDRVGKTALDEKWSNYTQATLERIGKDHPVFVISSHFLD